MDDPFLNDPTLSDPDSEVDSRYRWDEEFQRHIIALLVSDRQFMLQSVDLVKPSYFTNKAHQKMCSIAFTFFKKYRLLPKKDFIVQEIKNNSKDDKSLLFYLGEVNTVYDYFQPGMDARDYLMDKITYFAKMQAFRKAFHNGLKLLDDNPESEENWQKIYNEIEQVVTTTANYDLGTDYFQSIKDRYAEMAEEGLNDERFITGLEGIDMEINGGGYLRGEMISIVAGSGVGKCHRKGTPILLHDGTVKLVENIVVGDVLMGDDSTPRIVKKLARGKDSMYRIKPTKGKEFFVNSEHVLVLKNSANGRYKNSNWRCEDGLFHIPVKNWLLESKRFQKDMKLVRTGVDFSYKDVRIDPYVLGIWLGDGNSRCPKFTTENIEVLNSLWIEARTRKLHLWENEEKGSASSYSLSTCKRGEDNSFLNDLRSYELLQNKHIPYDFKCNERSVRLDLLAGLIDSDGSKVNNCYEFVNKNRRLTEDVVYLARSLGFAAYYGKDKVIDGMVYKRVFISGETSLIPVRIPYKKCQTRTQVKDVLVSGIVVDKVSEQEDYFGFEVDGNHRYLLGDFTITHNSVMLACLTSTNLLRGKKGVYITLELAERKVADRMDAILTGFPVQCLYSHKDEIFDKLTNLNGIDYEADAMPLVIKQFPAGQASVNTIRAYISQLRFHGFDPDFVIVDYVGEMQDYPGMKTYESREKIVRDLRGMATEEQVFLATAMQPNRSSKEDQRNEKSKIDDSQLADSFGQIRPLDGCISLNQNDVEKELGIGRAYIIKQRDGRSRYQIYLRFDKENLRITQIHMDTYKSMRNAHKESVNEEVEFDQIHQPTAKDAWAEALDDNTKAMEEARERAKEKFNPPDEDDS